MTRTWKILAIVAFILIVVFGGKFVGVVVLTLLMPVYAIFLASIIFIIFLVVAAIVVPTGQYFLKRAEARSVVEETAEDQRKAA
jgi:hypothetical protein